MDLETPLAGAARFTRASKRRVSVALGSYFPEKSRLKPLTIDFVRE
jgi:hypothetical protein